jgi:hypothetical protein
MAEMDESLLTPEVVASEFGWAAAFLEDPELGPLLRKAADPKNRWTAEKLQTEVMKTKWWKSSTEAQRAWQKLEAQGDQEAKKRVDDRADSLRDIAAGLGGQLSETQLVDVATNALRFGLTESQVVRMVANELLRGSDPANVLRTGIAGQSVRQIARSMALPMSEEALDEWSRKIATGTAVIGDFENEARRMARGMYPSIEKEIDRGVTVDTLFDPYRQYAARLLGVTPDSVDFTDPKWNVALNHGDEKGRRSMTLREWGDMLRQDERYGYQFTDEAINKAYEVSTLIGRSFGRV